MALNLSGTSGITGAGIGTIDASGSNVTGVGTFTQLEVDEYIKHVGDTNTAIRFPTNDSIALETGGAEKFRVHDTGFAEFTGGSDLRVCFGSQGTAGTNDSNWVRASGVDFMYNAASGHHKWEVGGTEKLRLQSGGGISFNGDTAVANALDDYEEGTWTPAFTNVSAPTYTSQTGRYVKIGIYVHCTGLIAVGSGLDTSDGSTFAITDLPYTGNGDQEACIFTLGRYFDLLGSKGTALRSCRFTGLALLLQESNNDGISYSEGASSGTLEFAFSYSTN